MTIYRYKIYYCDILIKKGFVIDVFRLYNKCLTEYWGVNIKIFKLFSKKSLVEYIIPLEH